MLFSGAIWKHNSLGTYGTAGQHLTKRKEGKQMHFVDAKGILTGSGGHYGMNIYRGCSHGSAGEVSADEFV